MKKNNFFIGNKEIGLDVPSLIIAEIGLAHDGSLGAAHSFIDSVAYSGADAIKFQTHIAEDESSPNEPFRLNVFPQDKNRYEYWIRTSFTEEQWLGLKKHAEERNLLFLSTPFSNSAVNLLARIGIKGWKVGSGETNNLLLLEKLSSYNLPIILSSGMSYMSELDTCIDFLKNQGIPISLMQCTSKYPSSAEEYGLNMINLFKERYKIPIGFSDHSGDISTAIAATALGAKIIEVHITWDKECFGPDSMSSLTLNEFRTCIKGIRNIEKSLENPVNKDQLAFELSDMRYLFCKGLIANQNIPKGSIITKEMVEARKPCIGIPAFEYHKVIGKIAVKEISKGDSFKNEDLNK